MNRKGQSKGALIGLLAVIVIAVFFAFRQHTARRTAPHGVDWVCEACDYKFISPFGENILNCPQCPGEAVRSYIFYDASENELVELYRSRPPHDVDPEISGALSSEELLYKRPGEDWEEYDQRIEDQFGFPVRVDRPDDFEYAPPGSEHRR